MMNRNARKNILYIQFIIKLLIPTIISSNKLVSRNAIH